MMQTYDSRRDAIKCLAAAIMRKNEYGEAAETLAALYLQHVLHTRQHIDGTIDVFNCPKIYDNDFLAAAS
jgi:hypothetical protein